MKMYGVKNEKKNVVGLVLENLTVEVDKEVFDDVFEGNWDLVKIEVNMIYEDVYVGDNITMKFVKNENNLYDVYVNDVMYGFGC